MARLKTEIYRLFEQSWDPVNFSLDDFVSQYAPQLTREEQLELVRLDLRKRFQSGQTPPASVYQKIFPQLAGLIERVVAIEKIGLASEEAGPFSGPRRIGNFEIIEATDEDSASVHYYAIQRRLDRRVKVRAFQDADPNIIGRAKLIALLDHPNLENTVDLIQRDDNYYLVSQYEYGNSLFELLENSSELITPARAVKWIKCIVDALMESHRYDIAHLAICPRNILIRESGEAVLLNPSMDVNLGKKISSSESGSRDSLPFPYRSLTFNGASNINLWMADTISIGLIFFQMLTRMPMRNFYEDAPLPQEATRLKKLIVDQLEYVTNVEPELKSTCRKATVDAMTGINTWGLLDFYSELVVLESLFDEETAVI